MSALPKQIYYLPLWNPSWLHTTAAAALFQLSLQTLPHVWLTQTSTAPAVEADPPTRRTASLEQYSATIL